MIETNTINNTIEKIKEESNRLQGLSVEISKVIVGQDEVIKYIIIAILCDGHILLEGVPGVAKTTMIKALTRALGLTFNRIQFTPDLLPADLIGTLIYNPKTHEFETKKGPIFANLILADEINRAPAKVQSALLEAMQEQQVTIGSTTFKLAQPFLVFATQNPIEQEGTYRLPEAQIDRFIFKLQVNYPSKKQEAEIIRRKIDLDSIQTVLTKDDIFKAQERVGSTYVDEKIIEYITNIVFSTRQPKTYLLDDIASYIQYGVSPRATIALYNTSKAHAFLQKRHFVTPDDVKAVAPAVLSHRLILSYEAEADNIKQENIIKKILDTIPSP
ncbi:MAG: MoxR family ATPase [bacterium]|nr:MoxR family ATPase [bacterium]